VSLLLQLRPFDEVFSVIAVVALLLLLLLVLLVEEGLRSVAIATATAAVAGWLEDPASFVSKKNKTKVKVRPYLTRRYFAPYGNH
jgi:hypothetical protein